MLINWLIRLILWLDGGNDKDPIYLSGIGVQPDGSRDAPPKGN